MNYLLMAILLSPIIIPILVAGTQYILRRKAIRTKINEIGGTIICTTREFNELTSGEQLISEYRNTRIKVFKFSYIVDNTEKTSRVRFRLFSCAQWHIDD